METNLIVHDSLFDIQLCSPLKQSIVCVSSIPNLVSPVNDILHKFTDSGVRKSRPKSAGCWES